MFSAGFVAALGETCLFSDKNNRGAQSNIGNALALAQKPVKLTLFLVRSGCKTRNQQAASELSKLYDPLCKC